MGFTILGTGSALPERSVSNDELSEFLDTSAIISFPPKRAPLLSAWVPHVLPSTFRRLVLASFLRSMSPRAISPEVAPSTCWSLPPSR